MTDPELDRLDAVRLPTRHEPVTDDDPAPPAQAAALVAAVEAEGGDPTRGHLVWRVTTRAVLDADGFPAGTIRNRSLVITNCAEGAP